MIAYIALRLVDQGLLSLDEPLNSYLPEPWLPASEYRDVITMRHVLSHTSGLGHLTNSRDSLFAPGLGYSYSAIGFHYLQAVIEQVTGQSLEEVAQEILFTPLGMSSSSFVNPTELTLARLMDICTHRSRADICAPLCAFLDHCRVHRAGDSTNWDRPMAAESPDGGWHPRRRICPIVTGGIRFDYWNAWLGRSLPG